MYKEKTNKIERKIIPLAYDTVFKAVFIKEQQILLKMLKDIFNISDIEDTFTMIGYETPPSKFGGKTYRGDILVRLSDKSYILIEMNYSNDYTAIDRNLVQLTRIHNQILKEGETDIELSQYRLRGLNFNNFRNKTENPIENYAICNLDNNEIATRIYTFCNIDIEKCKELVYDVNVEKLPKAVRWGAILKENDINKISYILGEDMLTSEEKEGLLKTMENISNDKNILDDWLLEALARDKVKCQIEYAKQEAIREGLEQGIEKGLEQGIEKGIEQGLEQGIKQGTQQGEEKSKREITKNLLNMNLDYELISKATGKTIDEIKEIAINI